MSNVDGNINASNIHRTLEKTLETHWLEKVFS